MQRILYKHTLFSTLDISNLILLIYLCYSKISMTTIRIVPRDEIKVRIDDYSTSVVSSTVSSHSCPILVWWSWVVFGCFPQTPWTPSPVVKHPGCLNIFQDILSTIIFFFSFLFLIFLFFLKILKTDKRSFILYPHCI